MHEQFRSPMLAKQLHVSIHCMCIHYSLMLSESTCAFLTASSRVPKSVPSMGPTWRWRVRERRLRSRRNAVHQPKLPTVMMLWWQSERAPISTNARRVWSTSCVWGHAPNHWAKTDPKRQTRRESVASSLSLASIISEMNAVEFKICRGISWRAVVGSSLATTNRRRVLCVTDYEQIVELHVDVQDTFLARRALTSRAMHLIFKYSACTRTSTFIILYEYSTVYSYILYSIRISVLVCTGTST